MVEHEFCVTFIAHRERPVTRLETEVQEESCSFHDDIDPDQLLALICLGQLDVDGTNVCDIERRRPLVVDAWETEAKLLLCDLTEE